LQVSSSLTKGATQERDRQQVQEALNNAVPKADEIPIYKYMSEGNVQETLGHQRLLISENLVLETRLAFMCGVTKATANMFHSLWDAFSEFSMSGRTSGFPAHARLFMSCIDFTANQLPLKNPTMRDWQFTSSSELNQCCAPETFGYFVAGYQLACLDKQMKSVFMADYSQGNQAKQELGQREVVHFPMVVQRQAQGRSGTSTLSSELDEALKTNLKRWVNSLNQGKKESSDKFRDATVSAVHESAEVAAEIVRRSTAFSGDNPFVEKMVDFSFGMLQRLFIHFTTTESGKPGFVFTTFQKYLQDKKTSGSMKYVKSAIDLVRIGEDNAKKVEALGQGMEVLKAEYAKKSALTESARLILGKLTEDGLAAVSEARKALEKVSKEVDGHSIYIAYTVGDAIPSEKVELFGTELSDQINEFRCKGTKTTRFEEFEEAAGDGDEDGKDGSSVTMTMQAKESDPVSSSPQAFCPPASFGSFESVSLVEFKTHSTDKSVEQSEEMSQMLWPSLSAAKPNIVVLVRDCAVESSTLDPNEEELKGLIDTLPTVGLTVWITSEKNPVTMEENDTKQVCLSVKTPKKMYQPDDLLWQGGKPLASLARLLHTRHSCIKELLHQEQAKAMETLEGTIRRASAVLVEYQDYKVKSPLCTVLQKKMEKLRTLMVDKLKQLPRLEPVVIEIPKREFLCQEPFVCTAQAVYVAGRKLSEVNEVMMREFLFKAILCQLISHARQKGEQIFGAVVQPIIQEMAGEWNLRADDLMRYIEEHKASKGDQKEGQKIMHMTAFLSRQRFTTMYIGGTVLALVPLIRALVMAKLRHPQNGPGPDDVKKDDYDRKKMDADRHFNLMTITDK